MEDGPGVLAGNSGPCWKPGPLPTVGVCGGLVLAGVKLGGAAPLYSAHLGHLRLVSVCNNINQYGLCDRRCQTYSYGQLDRSVHNDARAERRSINTGTGRCETREISSQLCQPSPPY